MAGGWCCASELAHSTTYCNCNLQRMVHRHMHKGGPEVVVLIPGRAGADGDRMPTAVRGKRHQRCSSLLGAFLCSDAKDRPMYLTPMYFVCNGDSVPTGLLCADPLLGETAPGGCVCAFELVWGQWQQLLQYDWGQRQAPHLFEGRHNVERTWGATRYDPVNCRTYWTDWLYPFLEALDPPGMEHQMQLGRNDAGGFSPLGSFLHSDAKHHLTYNAPTLSFVCDGNSAPICPPYVDCLLGGTAGGDTCTFESFGGSGCFLCRDCCLLS
jgi:hypothetical protein